MAESWQTSVPASRDVGGAAAPIDTVHITLVGGTVDVVPHRSAGAARVEVLHVEGSPVTTTHDGSGLRIEQLKDAQGQFWGVLRGFLSGESRARARLTVAVPPGASVTVRTATADVLLGGLAGDVTVQTATGAVTLDALTGRVDVTTGTGALDGHALSGDLKAKTASGNLTIQAARLRSAKLATVSGTSILDIAGGPTLVTANTVSGDVTIRLPRALGFDVNAVSRSGQVVVDGARVVGESGGPGGHQHEGDRAVAVKARSVSGAIVVLRDDAAEPPGPPGSAGAAGPVVTGPHPGSADAQDTPPDGPAPGAAGHDGTGA